MTVKLVTDSTSYIEESTLKSLDIKMVHLSVSFPDESFKENDVPYPYFYQKLEKEGTIPASSQPTLGEIYNAFKEIVMNGEEVLGIFISAKMSGTYETALAAKNMILEEYPKALIQIMDSKTNCMALGIQVIEAAVAAKAGKTMREVVERASSVLKRVHFYFVPATLKYLIKGGRIGGASALIGSMLQIRPILYVNDGMTDVLEKVRGNRRAVSRMVELLYSDVQKNGIRHLLVHHIHDEKRGRELALYLSQQYQRAVAALPIGPVIGTHVGPGAIGIVYCTEK